MVYKLCTMRSGENMVSGRVWLELGHLHCRRFELAADATCLVLVCVMVIEGILCCRHIFVPRVDSRPNFTQLIQTIYLCAVYESSQWKGRFWGSWGSWC